MAGKKSFLYFGGTNRVNPTNTETETRFDFDEAEIWNVVIESDEGKMPWLLKKQTKNRGSKLVAENDHRRSVYVSSSPLKIPDQSGTFKGDDDEDEEEYGRLPPHEYLARRKGSSFSVHEGIGRTLKGRDMSRVRNAVWKQTGFED